MIQALYSAAGAMKSQQTNLDIIANNVSNVSTDGFKASRVDFKDAIYAAMLSPVNNDPDQNHQLGHGVHVAQATRVFTQGALTDSDSMLDFAIEGEGFFAIQTATGETRYTRDGHFNVSVEAGGNFLVAADGSYVLGTDGNRISLPALLSELAVSPDGRISVGETATGAQIAVYRFLNNEGLLAVGDGRYAPSENSGDAALAQGGYTIRQAAVESSNVNLAEEFSRLIKMQRAYQLASRALTTSDEMEGTANNIRG
ncbi:flagellar hook-basal body protein [Oscillospiraceae bacterium OttesenSCG-928-G22]|nr:flagellar hook-basal body protein [Oscillospiraceae bacterium OttesenSCG-928-G22]